MLRRLGPLTTHFRRRSGKVSHYREFLFFDDGDLCVAGYDEKHATRPLRVNGETVFDKSFKAFRIQRVRSTHTTILIYSLDDRFLGTYSDTTMPWGGIREVAPGVFDTVVDDLYLDHFIFPDGRSFVLDLGEFYDGLSAKRVSQAEALMALETVGWIEDEYQGRRYPNIEALGFDLDPRLLRDLPASQEG